jgi:uncharacterized protein (DUF4415 family)
VRENRTDWKRVREQSEEELAEAIRNDPDDEGLEPGWFDRALLVEPSPPKERITMWIDADVLEWFRAQGRGYQTAGAPCSVPSTRKPARAESDEPLRSRG